MSLTRSNQRERQKKNPKQTHDPLFYPFSPPLSDFYQCTVFCFGATKLFSFSVSRVELCKTKTKRKFEKKRKENQLFAPLSVCVAAVAAASSSAAFPEAEPPASSLKMAESYLTPAAGTAAAC